MIKKTLFLFFFYSGVIFVCIFFLPSLILPQKIVIYGGKILGFWAKFCIETFLSTKLDIKYNKSDSDFSLIMEHGDFEINDVSFTAIPGKKIEDKTIISLEEFFSTFALEVIHNSEKSTSLVKSINLSSNFII